MKKTAPTPPPTPTPAEPTPPANPLGSLQACYAEYLAIADRITAVMTALNRHEKAPSVAGFDWAVAQWPKARNSKALMAVAGRDIDEVLKRITNDADNMSAAMLRAIGVTSTPIPERAHGEWLSTLGWEATSVRIGDDWNFLDFCGVRYIPGDMRFAGVPPEGVYTDERANVRYLLVLGYREWASYSLKLPLRVRASSLVELADMARGHLAGLDRAAAAARQKEFEDLQRKDRERAAQRVVTAGELAAVAERIRQEVKAELGATAPTG